MIRRLYCWLFGHATPVITGRLRTSYGDYRTMVCFHCKAQWNEPIPKTQVTL